ncbi:MAG TPA: thermonuclease family protein [Acidimicrobiales bacterium]|nr:thermonuclease family protein [Acidimicrobiales bacterium]
MIAASRNRSGSPLFAVVALALGGLGAFLLLTTLSGGPSRPGPRPGAAGNGLPAGLDVTVERVVDGDTIVVSGGESVRLIGADTPETKDPRRPVGCFGKQASDFTAGLLPSGTRVRLVGDVEQRDRYQRLLAYVYRLPDGLFVNAELLRRGFGQVLTIPPNVAHSEQFVALARGARESGRGLWGECRGPGP